MTPTYACKNGSRRYRYYTCLNALQRGRQACPSKSLPAPALEEFVIEQIQKLAQKSSGAAVASRDLIAELTDWGTLPAEEQARRLQRWVQCVEYDGGRGKLSITLHSDVATQAQATNGRARNKKE